MARRPRPWDGVRPGAREARPGYGSAPHPRPRRAPGAASTASSWLCWKVEGPGPAREERARKARGGAAEGAGGSRPRPVPTPCLPRPPRVGAALRGARWEPRAAAAPLPSRCEGLPDCGGCALSLGRTGCHGAVSRTPSKSLPGDAGAKAEGSRGDCGAQQERHASADYTRLRWRRRRRLRNVSGRVGGLPCRADPIALGHPPRSRSLVPDR